MAFKEAMEPEFKEYQARVVKNAKAMVAQFQERGYKIVSNSTENHLFLVDLIDKTSQVKKPMPLWALPILRLTRTRYQMTHAARL